MIKRIFLADFTGAGADDDGQFHFPIHLLRHPGVVLDRIAGPDHGCGRLGEHHRLLGQIHRGIQRLGAFGNVLDIVQPDAKDVLARARDRGQQFDIGQRGGGPDRKRPARLIDGMRKGIKPGLPRIDQPQHAVREILADGPAECKDIHHEITVNNTKLRAIIG